MRVLFASSEIDPLAKTGGLADVASSLPKALKKGGIEIFLIMPFTTFGHYNKIWKTRLYTRIFSKGYYF